MKSKPVYVVYDGECPFCRTYCNLVRIRHAVGELVLVDARQSSHLMEEITALSLDIDQGMVVKIDDQIYYGPEAINILALLGTRSGAFNQINYWIFKSKAVSKFLYPVLRDCRNLALWLMGIPLINNLAEGYSNEQS